MSDAFETSLLGVDYSELSLGGHFYFLSATIMDELIIPVTKRKVTPRTFTRSNDVASTRTLWIV